MLTSMMADRASLQGWNNGNCTRIETLRNDFDTGGTPVGPVQQHQDCILPLSGHPIIPKPNNKILVPAVCASQSRISERPGSKTNLAAEGPKTLLNSVVRPGFDGVKPPAAQLSGTTTIAESGSSGGGSVKRTLDYT
jgi:hypothetical protein